MDCRHDGKIGNIWQLCNVTSHGIEELLLIKEMYHFPM